MTKIHVVELLIYFTCKYACQSKSHTWHICMTMTVRDKCNWLHSIRAISTRIYWLLCQNKTDDDEEEFLRFSLPACLRRRCWHAAIMAVEKLFYLTFALSQMASGYPDARVSVLFVTAEDVLIFCGPVLCSTLVARHTHNSVKTISHRVRCCRSVGSKCKMHLNELTAMTFITASLGSGLFLFFFLVRASTQAVLVEFEQHWHWRIGCCCCCCKKHIESILPVVHNTHQYIYAFVDDNERSVFMAADGILVQWVK